MEEKVSVQRASDTYGVIINTERHTVDWEATRRQREALGKEQRKA